MPIGYLLVVEPRPAVFVGGLLVTTHRGRPLEFQATAPVTPNATQQLLYGRTLRPHVCGEVIGAALLKKAATKPRLVLTSSVDSLDVRAHVTCPVAVLLDDGRGELEAGAARLAGGASAEESLPDDSPAGDAPAGGAPISDAIDPATRLELGPLKLAVHGDYLEDIGQIRSLGLDVEADLTEPLDRVAEALGQTLRNDAA